MYRNRYLKESDFFVCKTCGIQVPAFLTLGFRVRDSIYLDKKLEYYIGSSVGLLMCEVAKIKNFFEKSIEL